MSTATLAPPEPPPAFAPAVKRVHAASLLKQASTGTKAKKQSGLLYDGDLTVEAARILHLKRTVEEQERELTLAKSQLRRVLEPWYHDRIATGGYESTVRIPASKGGDALRATFQHRYSAIPLELESHLRAVLGDDERFDRYFKPTASLKLKKEVADDPELLAKVVEEIAEAVGPERFSQLFEATQGLYPSKGFTENRWRELSQEQNDKIAAFGCEQVVAFGEVSNT